MTLQELKITSYLYSRFSNYDENYIHVSATTFDLTKDDDNKKMLKFLRDWGCRQFKKDDEHLSANSLKNWFQAHSSSLPLPNILLIDSSDQKIRSFNSLFDDLMNSLASIKNWKEKNVDTRVGPVGAAKALFGLRKNYFPPWDNPVIEKLEKSKDGDGYCEYLILIKNELLTLKDCCKKKSIDINNLPTILGRPHTSLAKLADEYFWVSITRKCNPKEIIELAKSTSKTGCYANGH